ncbi:hypothetical protein AX15_000486 [Amanita polypyramis BW_CC]|nr:hypothetical protein AX15_000486 [Amanita polypyramis BW_CC]
MNLLHFKLGSSSKISKTPVKVKFPCDFVIRALFLSRVLWSVYLELTTTLPSFDALSHDDNGLRSEKEREEKKNTLLACKKPRTSSAGITSEVVALSHSA